LFFVHFFARFQSGLIMTSAEAQAQAAAFAAASAESRASQVREQLASAHQLLKVDISAESFL
jgi:hypothetical protein